MKLELYINGEKRDVITTTNMTREEAVKLLKEYNKAVIQQAPWAIYEIRKSRMNNYETL